MLLFLQLFVFLTLCLQYLSYQGDPPLTFGGGDPSGFCWGYHIMLYFQRFSGLFMMDLWNVFYLQFLSVIHHQLCLRELFFHGLGSRLGVPSTKVFRYVMCVYSIMYTKFTDFGIGSLYQPYRHIFAHYWLGTILVVSLPVFSCLQLSEDSWNVYRVQGKVLFGIVNWKMLKILEWLRHSNSLSRGIF